MSEPLDSVWLKVIRAKEHLDALYAEILEFLRTDPQPYAIQPEHNREGSEYVFHFKVNREPPTEWSVAVGDVTYNLRSALDHLAWQLALKHTRDREPRSATTHLASR